MEHISKNVEKKEVNLLSGPYRIIKMPWLRYFSCRKIKYPYILSEVRIMSNQKKVKIKNKKILH